jgi:hypothetical protein
VVFHEVKIMAIAHGFNRPTVSTVGQIETTVRKTYWRIARLR